ncbi:hypothetical protein UlMin_041517 [Ulmus minor]
MKIKAQTQTQLLHITTTTITPFTSESTEICNAPAKKSRGRRSNSASPKNRSAHAPLIDFPTFKIFYTSFLALTRSILYQKLAYKTGIRSINLSSPIFSQQLLLDKLMDICGGEPGVVPEAVLAPTPQQYCKLRFLVGKLATSMTLQEMLSTKVTMVNGIGSWYVHMFMIFLRHNPDEGMKIIYSLKELPQPSHMDQLCEKWQPYWSVVAWYLWRFQQQHHGESHHAHQLQLMDPLNMLNIGNFQNLLHQILQFKSVQSFIALDIQFIFVK